MSVLVGFRGGGRKVRKCVRAHKLPLLCCSFGFFWCGLAVVMIYLYMRMVISEIEKGDKPFKPVEEPKRCEYCFL
ncbi:hypothetical protein V1264_007132 [Littorina saxatilis]|uniref:Uncharacterized protein n=1 Tax=Littorina saxatilis TaxID=31220 RepID=A0AAN9AUT6_9CAEN